MQKCAKKFCFFLILLMPLALFLSYHPVISLGENSAMNFEFSIAEIWLFVFFLTSLPFVKKISKFYGWKKLLLASVIPSYFTLSIIWSPNRLRTLLTAGLFWLIVFAALNLIYWLKTDKTANLRRNLVKSLLATSLFVSIFCWAQCLLDLANVPQEQTLLCAGCTATKFGFPHPNGFAIEPQFMGNLLLAPILLCFYLLVSPKGAKNLKKSYQKIALIFLTVFLTTTLFLTFSRGAIYAFLVAFVLELILIFVKNRGLTIKKAFILPIIVAVFSFGIGLCTQGIFATLSSTSDTFVSGISKSIHQLSLGKIDLRSEETKNTNPVENETTDSETSQFSGYVAESTDVRLNRNQVALRAWVSKPQYLLVGTGLGGAGVAMNQAFPDELGPKEIVQNEYVSLLLEAGILGYLLIATVIIIAIKLSTQTNKKIKKQILFPLFCSTILAFLLTLLFFSGLPNAIHLYLFPLIFIGLGSAKNDTIIE